MESKIKITKKRSLAFILALVFVIVQSVPLNVKAQRNYYMIEIDTEVGTIIAQPDDQINYKMDNSDRSARVNIVYKDYDGTVLKSTGSIISFYFVEEYTGLSGALPDEQFKGWKITGIESSGGYVSGIEFQAVAYKKSTITYVLHGGTNNPSNPDFYYEGKENITLYPATEDEYGDFEGWRLDNMADSEKIETITTDMTGDITLIAFYNPKSYSIIYHNVDGATNPNPSTYKCYEGITGFADATKEDYTFGGWYSDAELTTKITGISIDQSGDVDVYAKFTPNTYTINYELDGGENASTNPTEYTYGVGVDSFADATKAGHTFNGWYSDAAFTNKVTEITATQLKDVTLYAKFTVGTYAISYELDGGKNASTNPAEYTYGVGVASFAKASKEGYIFAGWYSDAEFKTKITKITETNAGDITLYAKFTEKKEGTGSISVADVKYGILPSPVIVSDTNGTGKAVVEYKKKVATDAEYSTTKPVAVGAYVARVIFPETDYYHEVIATCEFTISYLETPKVPYRIVGKTGEQNYYVSDVAIVPAEGYLISDSLDGTYSEKIDIQSSTDGIKVYLMNESTREKTSGIRVPEIKIDKFAPVIENVTNDSIVYGDNIEVIIRDINLNNVLVNGETIEIENGKAILQLASNNGEESYEIICTDIAGNKSEIKLVVSANWMQTRLIPLNEKVKLLKEYSYTLGGGKWKVFGDSTVYAGDTSFYVTSDGEYTFSQEK